MEKKQRGAPKGRPRPAGSGRPKGGANKATADARAAIAQFVDGNAHRLQEWLDRVADGVQDPDKAGKWLVPPDPGKAAKLFTDVIEYHVPRLARQEITGRDGADIGITQITRVIVGGVGGMDCKT